MTTNNHPARAGRSKKIPQRECAGQCSRMLPESLGFYAFCSTCWNVNKVCLDEAVASLHEIATRWRSRQELLWRVADILQRSGVEDADLLLRELERRLP